MFRARKKQSPRSRRTLQILSVEISARSRQSRRDLSQTFACGDSYLPDLMGHFSYLKKDYSIQSQFSIR